MPVVKGRHPYCWSCSVMGHMAKVCPSKKSTPRPSQIAVVVSGEVPGRELKDVSKKGRKTPSPPHNKRSPSKQKPKKGRNKKSSTSHCLSPLKGSIKEKRSNNSRIKRNGINKNLRILSNQKEGNSVKTQIWKWRKCLSPPPPPRLSSLKRGRDEEEDKIKMTNILKRRSGLNKAGRKGSQTEPGPSSLLRPPAESNILHKSRNLSPSPTRTLSPLPPHLPCPTPPGRRRKRGNISLARRIVR